jgi:hypothetical protein
MVPERSLVWPLAPALGWAIQSTGSHLMLCVVGFSTTAVRGGAGLALLAAIVALVLTRQPVGTKDHAGVPPWAWIGAALLALIPAVAVLPKSVGDGVILAGPIFDHAKVALIDEISRLGLPPGNPFFGDANEPPRLAYYYLWYFSAAQLSAGLGVSGWEADAALTWFTAFASLLLMVGLAGWFSARRSTAVWVLLCSLAASLRPLLELVLGAEQLYAVILPPTGFAGWLFQAAWVPHHLASASCVILASFLLGQLGFRRSPVLLVVFVLVVLAGFESSTWVGGVTFGLAAPVCGLALLARMKPAQQLAFLLRSTIAALLAIGLAFPLLRDQYLATQMRGEGMPIALEPMGVFEDLFSEETTQIEDLPGYWLILLNLEFPAIYLTGSIGLIGLLAAKSASNEQTRVALTFAALLVTSLMVAWLLASSFGDNNDLGWRAALPAIMVLTIFAAVGLTRWLRTAKIAAAAAILAIVLGVPDGVWLTYQFASGRAAPSAAVFASTPAMWAAVRRYSGPSERIGNNPHFLQDMTRWPVNISWALLSNRRSCFAGNELALAFAPLSEARRNEIDAQFVRVFAGDGSLSDVEELANRYECRVIVVTAQDGAFMRDPFATSPRYRLAELETGKWKIYVAAPNDHSNPTWPPRSPRSVDAASKSGQ